MTYVRDAIDRPTAPCYCWTDSTVTLAWLRKSPAVWKTFVANRVAEVQTLLPTTPWRHVPTKDNPADCASRGILPSELANHPLWWTGPMWLRLPAEHWPDKHLTPSADDITTEERATIAAHHSTESDPWDLATRYSSWTRLLRVTAYLRRFGRNCRSRSERPNATASERRRVALVPSEIRAAKFFWLRQLQSQSFPDERRCLAQSRPVAPRSPFASLAPYLDSDGLIRVGGRLENSALPAATKHPVITKSHPLLDLVIRHLTLTLLREEFWILRTRATVRAVLRTCVTCACDRAARPSQLMGNLPDARVSHSTHAFEHVGVDYAGPILVRTSLGRGHRTRKAYIALFVCMATKAYHLELVSDYSSTTFLAAFTRFASRRGIPTAMYSDNGTTFHGASRELNDAWVSVSRDANVRNTLASEGVAWHFLPPAAPHFGGLWEAGVRSVKQLLKRTTGNHSLTFEEMSTLLSRVGAVLNS